MTMDTGMDLAAETELPDRGQQFDESCSSGSVTLTVMSYLSIGEKAVKVTHPFSTGLLIKLPEASHYALSCLAVGIGKNGGRIVTALASACWFSHLQPAARGPSCGTMHVSVLNDTLEHMQGPHVASVALPDGPDWADVDAACAVAHAARQRGAFMVVTVSRPSHSAMVHLGRAFDCVVQGDGGVHHHWYPARTVTEPTGGRPICYDFYDVCSLWAGRIGYFEAVDPTADALHVEVSVEAWSLVEVDRLVAAKAANLRKPERLCLFNVVAGTLAGATAVSFSDSELIRQDRAEMCRNRGDKR